MAEKIDAFAGCKLIFDHKSYESDDFATEKELCDFLHNRPITFAREVLGIDYLGHEREFVISGDNRVNKNRKGRVDFMFNTATGCIFVECKKPKHSYSESVNAISQLLAYSCLADQYNRGLERMVLVTTRFNPILTEVIKKFKLAIEVYIVSQDNVMKLIIQ